MLLLTHALGGGNGSLGSAAGGASLAKADVSGCNRGASGKRSASIIWRSARATASRSSSERFSCAMGVWLSFGAAAAGGNLGRRWAYIEAALRGGNRRAGF